MKTFILAVLSSVMFACSGQIETSMCQTDIGNLPPDYVFKTVDGGTETVDGGVCEHGDRCSVKAYDGTYRYGLCQ